MGSFLGASVGLVGPVVCVGDARRGMGSRELWVIVVGLSWCGKRGWRGRLGNIL